MGFSCLVVVGFFYLKKQKHKRNLDLLSMLLGSGLLVTTSRGF